MATVQSPRPMPSSNSQTSFHSRNIDPQPSINNTPRRFAQQQQQQNITQIHVNQQSPNNDLK